MLVPQPHFGDGETWGKATWIFGCPPRQTAMGSCSTRTSVGQIESANMTAQAHGRGQELLDIVAQTLMISNKTFSLDGLYRNSYAKPRNTVKFWIELYPKLWLWTQFNRRPTKTERHLPLSVARDAKSATHRSVRPYCKPATQKVFVAE